MYTIHAKPRRPMFCKAVGTRARLPACRTSASFTNRTSGQTYFPERYSTLKSRQLHRLFVQTPKFKPTSSAHQSTRRFLLKMSPPEIPNTNTRLPYRLDGKVALVTGSGRGIGSAIAVELGRCGAKVVVNYAKSSGPAEKIVDEIKSFGRSADAVAIQGDVGDVRQTVALFEKAVKHFGQLNIVCSNSGVVSFGHLEDVTEVRCPTR